MHRFDRACLSRRSHVFWIRKAVPGDLAASLGKTDVRRSLKTSSPLVARQRARTVLIVIEEALRRFRRRPSLLTHSLPRRWRLDPSLPVECDLGDVSLRGTAYRLDPLPAPRRDRMRAVSVPQPAAEHRDALRAIVMNDVACERVMAAAWFEPLDGTACDLIADNWRGGSQRQLRRFVEAAMIARERGRTTPWMFGPGDSGRHSEPRG
jgi:hypothetical protein